MRARLTGLALGGCLGLAAATQMFAWTYGASPVLGPAWRPAADIALYPPWAILIWRDRFRTQAPDAIARSGMAALLGAVGGLALGAMTGEDRPRRIRGWSCCADCRERRHERYEPEPAVRSRTA